MVTRDFEPCKPHPAPVLHICEQWGLQPNQVAVVGDDKTDMISGLRAGTAGKPHSQQLLISLSYSQYKLHDIIVAALLIHAVNILLRNDRNKVQVDYSSFAVDTLTEICSLFDSPMTISPKEPPTQH